MTQNSSLAVLPLHELQEAISETMNKVFDTRINQLLPKEEEQYLTRKETAIFLGISLPTLHGYTATGKIIGYRMGTRVRYKKSELILSLKQINAPSI